MPVKRLTPNQRDHIFDIIDAGTMMDDDSDYSGLPDALNEVFARIYGYARNRRRPRRDYFGSRETLPAAFRKKRSPNDWNKFVKANRKKKKFQYRDGKLNLKKMGIAYRKTAVYKRNKKKR